MFKENIDILNIGKLGATLNGEPLRIGDHVEVPVFDKNNQRIWRKGVVSGIECENRRRIFIVIGDGRLTTKGNTIVLFGDDAAHLPLIRRLQYK